MPRWLTWSTNAFPFWVVLGGGLALVRPEWFTWFGREWITWGLAVIMLGMGITLSVDEFRSVLRMPRAVGAGFAAQYLIMPFLGRVDLRGDRDDAPVDEVAGGRVGSGAGGRLLLAVFLLHTGGFLLGYLFAWALGYDVNIRRTISIEVGMQNSGLGAVLAKNHFTDPLTALPCALSATMHSVIGSLLAGIWRLRPARVTKSPARGEATAAPVPP